MKLFLFVNVILLNLFISFHWCWLYISMSHCLGITPGSKCLLERYPCKQAPSYSGKNCWPTTYSLKYLSNVKVKEIYSNSIWTCLQQKTKLQLTKFWNYSTLTRPFWGLHANFPWQSDKCQWPMLELSLHVWSMLQADKMTRLQVIINKTKRMI